MGCGGGCSTPEVNTADSSCAVANNCGCAGSSPFYDQTGTIQETHCQSIIQQVFVAAVSTGSDFAMPTCNAKAVVNMPGLVSIQIGSYFWSALYGYLEVYAFDPISHDVTLVNECQGGNAAPGTVIPRCSLFTVTGPP